MPEQQLSNAYQEMRKSFEDPDSSALQPLHEAVQTVEKTIAMLHRRDKYGRLPLLDSKQKDELMAQHLAVGQAAETLIAAGLPDEQKNAVQSLSALAAENYRRLRIYNPKEAHSLPDILDRARTYVVDARNGTLSTKLSAGQNSRQPLTFLLDSGSEVTGVFTPKKLTTVWENWTKAFSSAALKAQGPNSDKIKNLMEHFMERLDTPAAAAAMGLPADADHRARLAAFYTQSRLDNGGDRDTKTMEMIAKISNIRLTGVPPVQQTPLKAEDVNELLKGGPYFAIQMAIGQNGTSIINNSIFAQVHDGARLDNRNAAMSAVASLLGVPSLVARSVPMKLINHDGKEVEGTFMMEAVGVDPANIRPEDSGLGGERALTGTDGRGFRSIADLQVLDYICGNTDRHAMNVTYQFDRSGKFVGVQGFDNDCSFGSYVPKEGDKHTSYLTTIENMGVISASMYEQIKRITPDMLKFTLRGFDLSEEELDAACARMQQVRKAAEKSLEAAEKRTDKSRSDTSRALGRSESPEAGNQLRVVPNEAFRTLDARSLSRECKKSWYNRSGPYDYKDGNFFWRAINTVKTLGSLFLKQRNHYRSLRSSIALGSDNRGNPGSPRIETAKGKVLEDQMRQCTWFNRSSPEFQAMQTAVANYTAFQEKLNQRIFNARESMREKDLNALDSEKDRDLLFSRVITFSDLQQMQELSLAMRNAAQTYLKKKDPEHNHYGFYTRNRIEVAREVLRLARPISDQEVETAVGNELQMLENARQSFGRVLEAEDKQAENKQAEVKQAEGKQTDKPQQSRRQSKRKKGAPGV